MDIISGPHLPSLITLLLIIGGGLVFGNHIKEKNIREHRESEARRWRDDPRNPNRDRD